MTHADIIKHFGGVMRAAEQLGYSRISIWKWRRGVPLRTQIIIEAKTGGVLKAKKRK